MISLVLSIVVAFDAGILVFSIDFVVIAPAFVQVPLPTVVVGIKVGTMLFVSFPFLFMSF